MPDDLYVTEGPFTDARTRDYPDMVNPVFEFLPNLAPSGLTAVRGNFDNGTPEEPQKKEPEAVNA